MTADGASDGVRPHVVIAIPVLLNGGTEIQTLSLARALVASHRVTVCCYHEHDDGMVERFRALGAEVALLGWSRARPLWRFVLALRKVFAAWRPDVVHVQYLAPGLAAVVAARLARVPVVLTTMHAPGYGLHVRVFVGTARVLSDAFICVSENLERFWCGTPARLRRGARLRHGTIRNCVDVEGLRAIARHEVRARCRAELGLGEAPTIGVVGRLRSEKGQRTMLAALPRILGRLPDAKLLVVGDGPDRVVLERLAEELGVAASVRWTGHVAHERVAELYAAMDVLAVPSRYEAFGLVAAEAMAMSLPVVGTETAGLSEVIAAGETGLLVPPDEHGAMADALLALLGDPARARAMGSRGSERARACFSRERYEREILATYARLTEGRRVT